jgi:hypothetical protein
LKSEFHVVGSKLGLISDFTVWIKLFCNLVFFLGLLLIVRIQSRWIASFAISPIPSTNENRIGPLMGGMYSSILRTSRVVVAKLDVSPLTVKGDSGLLSTKYCSRLYWIRPSRRGWRVHVSELIVDFVSFGQANIRALHSNNFLDNLITFS